MIVRSRPLTTPHAQSHPQRRKAFATRMLGATVVWGLLWTGRAVAVPPLPPADAIARAVDAAPEVRAARARAVEAGFGARLVAMSPYDWVASGSSARRRIDSEGRFGEWSTALERQVRWPGKATVDQRLGALQVDQATAELSSVLRQTRVTVLEAWFACLQAAERARLLDNDLEYLAELTRVIEKRRRAGDLAELDEALATAELATASAETATARTDAINAARLLATRLDDTSCSIANWDSPDPQTVVSIRPPSTEAQLSADPAVRASIAAAERARVAAQRARLERWPDPTLGVTYGSERGGAERIGGLSVSVPIGVGRRRTEAARAEAAANAASADLDVARADALRLQLQVESERLRAHQAWRSLADADRQQRRAIALSGRAFELGETSLAESLVVRRAALQTRLAERSAALDAWRADAIQATFVAAQDHGAAPQTQPTQ